MAVPVHLSDFHRREYFDIPDIPGRHKARRHGCVDVNTTSTPSPAMRVPRSRWLLACVALIAYLRFGDAVSKAPKAA
jgi:hypothetical protein